MKMPSSGPWKACKEGKCSCKQVWSVGEDHPVATIEAGAWGDRWPAIRVEEGINGKAEAYMESMDYGHIDEEVAQANALLIEIAGTAAHKVSEMGCDPFEVFNRLDELLAKLDPEDVKTVLKHSTKEES